MHAHSQAHERGGLPPLLPALGVSQSGTELPALHKTSLFFALPIEQSHS